ncbi:Hsp20/alpha crystallin family protein [Paenibacillus cisolokensis]|jgi:HSP20 family protein|uniref:Hsp20/alpha crystallin family protein n=1 Tax=Paenibacillus TaxID=44249 RepID=UPI00071F70FA|nr:Hsp20/alpha crystallin family protein [Paenibacillus sp. 32O-W]ALS27525.1 small heat shock protein HSP20 [Paenibacillus sp. 32O-W]
MSLIPQDSFRNLDSWRRDLDRWFNELPSFIRGEHRLSHRIDVHETDDEIVATCELPGLEKKEDIDIDVQGNVLTVSGTVNRSHEVKEEQIYHQERFYGRFQRSITLPAAVNEDAVKASYKNGVLEIRMPKLQQPKKRIDIDFH